jgi:hypothetical protein
MVHASKIMAKSKLPTFMTTKDGEVLLTGWAENTVARDLTAVMYADVPVLCFRVVFIVEAHNHTR